MSGPLMNPAWALPQGYQGQAADLQAQQQQLALQQAYAQQLQEQSAQGQPKGQMVGNIYVAPSWTQQLAAALKGPEAAYLNQQALTKGIDVNRQLGMMYSNALNGGGQVQPGANSASLMAGASGQNPNPPQSADGTPLTGAAGNGAGPTNANAALAAQLQNQGVPAQDTVTQPSNNINNVGLKGALISALYGENSPALKYLEPTDTARMLGEAGYAPGSPTAQAAYRDKLTPPIIARGNPVLTYGANGQLQVDPASLSAITQAENIKGGFAAPISLNTPSGSTVQISPTEWNAFQSGGNLPQRLLPQDQRDKIQADANATGQPGKVNIGGYPAGSVSPQGLGVSPSTFQTGLDKADADRVSGETTDRNNLGIQALNKIAQNNKMLELLPQITTGPLNKQITMFKSIGQNMGLNFGDPAPNQEFEKYAINGALAAAKQIYGSRITNQDVTTQIMSNPGATIMEKATRQLLAYDNQIQQNHVQKMTAAQDYQKNGGDLRNYNVWFAQNYPLLGNKAPAPGQSQGYQVPQPPAAQPNGSQDYANLYGLSPRQ